MCKTLFPSAYVANAVCVLKNSFISGVFRPYSPITISNIPNCPIYEKKGPTFVNDEFFPRQKCMNAGGSICLFSSRFRENDTLVKKEKKV